MLGSAPGRRGTRSDVQDAFHPCRAGPHAQPQGDRLPGPAPRGDGGHRPLGRGQVLARLRHHLRRRAAAVRRVDVHLRAAVPRPDGTAAGRRHPEHPPGRGPGGQERGAQRPLDGRARSPRRWTCCASSTPIWARCGARAGMAPCGRYTPDEAAEELVVRDRRRSVPPGGAPARPAARKGRGRRPRRADPPGLPAPPRRRRGRPHGAGREVAGVARSAAAGPRPVPGPGRREGAHPRHPGAGAGG